MSGVGRVRLPGYVLVVGDPAGTIVREIEATEHREAAVELVSAIKRDRRRAKKGEAALKKVEHVEGGADEATSAVEQADDLFETLVQGTVDPGSIGGSLDAVLNVAQRLDKEGRYAQEIRVGRAVSRPLAIAQRWLDLLASLRSTLHAAERAGDPNSAAWASHELGTLHLCANQPVEAAKLLERARTIRSELGDEAGLAVTDHNLQILCRLVRNLIKERRLRRPAQLLRSPIVLAIAAVLFGAGAAAGAVGAGASSKTRTVITSTTSSSRLRFNPSAPPPGTVGDSYSFAYAATGAQSIGYTITRGKAPPGLTLTHAGHLAGVPMTAGSWTFTVTAIGSRHAMISRRDTVAISTRDAPPIRFTSGPPSPGTVAQPYRFQVSANGDRSISYRVTAGGVPAGLTLSPSGLLTGIPTTAATSTFTVTATGKAGGRASQQDKMSIHPASAGGLTFTSSAPPSPVTVGASYSFQVVATGQPGIRYTATGQLPPGLSLSSSGSLTGTPTQAGTSTFTVTADGNAGGHASQQEKIVVVPGTTGSITFTSSAPPSPVTEGSAYSFQITATGARSIQYVLTAGSLPPGLSLLPSGSLTGTPTQAGTSTFTVTADGNGGGHASQQEQIVVRSSTTASITFTSSAPPSPVTEGSAYSFQITAEGDPSITYGASGSLPPGVSLSPSGLLSGTPTTVGTYAFTVTATGAGGEAATQPDTVTVQPQVAQ